MSDDSETKGSDFDAPEILEGMYSGAPLAMIVILMFIGIDWILLGKIEPGRFAQCVFVRAIVLSMCTGFLILTQRFIHEPNWKSQTERIRGFVKFGMTVYLVIGIGAARLVVLVGGGETSYFAGLILIFFGIAIMTPWKPRYTVLLLIVLLGVYVADTLTMENAWPPSTTARVNGFLLVTSLAMSWYGAHVIYVLHHAKEAGNGIKDVELLNLVRSSWKVFVGLLSSAFAIFYAVQTGSPNSTIADDGVPYLVRFIGQGEPDEALEFVNRVGSEIELSKGQIVLNGTNKVDVASSDMPPKVIPIGGEFRIYVQRQDHGYHLNQTNSFINGTARSRVRIYGFRLPKSN